MPRKKKLNIRIEFCKALKWTDAWILAPHAYVELWKDKKPSEVQGSYTVCDDQALVAYDPKGNVVGFISYYLYAVDNTAANISMAYVIPERRREGIHTALFEALVKHCTEHEIYQICSGVDLKNEASKLSSISQGRTPEYLAFSFNPPRKKKP